MDIIMEDQARDNKDRVLISQWENKEAVTPQNEQQQQQQPSPPSQLNVARPMNSLHELRTTVPGFATSFTTQLRLLLRRTMKQQRGERINVTSMVVTGIYILLSVVFWWRLPDNTGYLFERNSLLFFMIIAQSNQIVTSSMIVFQKERALLRRERSKKMYRVLSFFLANTMSDMTNNVFLPSIYGLATYFICGFRLSSFYHVVYFYIAFYLSMSTAQSMGLLLSISIPNIQIAMKVAPCITLFLMIMGGFYIPFSNMHVGIRWARWLSFATYGYSAMLINEYGYDRDIPCLPEYEYAPITIGGSQGECPLPGEQILESLGSEGIAANYWFNVAILIVLQISLRVSSYFILRYSK